MPIIIASSSDLDSSVMITGVNEFNSRRRRGATMRMNREGVELVSDIPNYTFLCSTGTYMYIAIIMCRGVLLITIHPARLQWCLSHPLKLKNSSVINHFKFRCVTSQL